MLDILFGAAEIWTKLRTVCGLAFRELAHLETIIRHLRDVKSGMIDRRWICVAGGCPRPSPACPTCVSTRH